MKTLLATLRDLMAVPALQYVIIRDDENNYYDDSYFYYIAYDLVNDCIIKHTHSATAYGGFKNLDNSVLVQSLPEQYHQQIRTLSENAALKQARDHIMDCETTRIMHGDTVTVTNEKARKHKGVTFVVYGLDEWRSRFGRVESVRAYNEDRSVITATTNLTVAIPSQHRVEQLADRILLGLRY